MTLFRYTARDAGGREISGEMEAASASAVAAELTSDGAIPVEILDGELAVPGQGVRGAGLRLFAPRVRLDELVILARQLHALTRSGVPLMRALAGLADTSKNPALRDALQDVCSSLHEGRDLASSLERHPRVFSRLFVASVHVGESMGRLEDCFADLATHLERESETIKRIHSAGRYPMLVVGAVVAAVAVINLFVVPAFSEVFATLGADLPLPTRILIATSDFFVNRWPFLLVGGAAGVLGARRWLATRRGRFLWDRQRLRLPIVGPVLERATLARFARGFSLALRSGLPVIQSLRLVGESTDNAWVCERIQSVSDRVSAGEALASAARASGLFTPLVLQMVAVGEESGSLEELLQEVAEYYEREVDHDLKRLSDAIEPVLIVVMGAIVLVLALAVYLPLWDMAGAMRS